MGQLKRLAVNPSSATNGALTTSSSANGAVATLHVREISHLNGHDDSPD